MFDRLKIISQVYQIYGFPHSFLRRYTYEKETFIFDLLHKKSLIWFFGGFSAAFFSNV